MLFRVLFSYGDGGVELFWTNSPPSVVLLLCLFVIICMLLHVNIQTGGCGVAEAVIAKSLLQKTV